MTISQTTFRYNPVKFHEMMEQRVFEEGRLNSSLLLSWAKESVLNINSITQAYFDGIRFDQIYLEQPDPKEDISYNDIWYMIVLSAFITPVTSIMKPFILRQY